MEHDDYPMIFQDDFCRHFDIAWRVEPGRQDPNNPLMMGEHPWDAGTPFYNGTVLKDPVDGLYKCWSIASPFETDHQWGQWDQRCAYATSEDGVHWRRPMLEGFPCLGQPTSNVLLDFADGGSCYQMSVLVDPDAEPKKRYEMFILRNPQYKNPSKRVKGLSLAAEHKNERGEPMHVWGLYRYFSPDGIHWHVAEGPLQMESADSAFVYKDLGAPYVAYTKLEQATPPGSAYARHDCAAGSIRRLVRRESPDGTHWSDPPLIVLTPDWRDAHDTQFMDIGPVREGRGFVATVAVFHALNQQMDIQFAGSLDGKRWFRPIPRVPCVPNGPLGEPGGGHIFQGHSLVVDGDRLHLYYAALAGLHSDIYWEDSTREIYIHGGLGRASWDRGRLWAAVPAVGGPHEGYLTTPARYDGDGRNQNAGKRLYINALTVQDGEISAELVPLQGGSNGSALEGFARHECRAFRGDSKCVQLTWQGGERCPQEGWFVRLYIRSARLYGFEWR